jgi:Ca2+-binding EF-hand superfamily protein
MFSRTLALTFGSLALASLSLVTTAEAQTRMRFQAMDRDNHGRITRDEWQGSQRSFDVHDWNNDGVLSGNEVLVGAQRDSRWEDADHNPSWRERNLSWTRSAFANLDHNRDNRLTPNEWHYDIETFRRVDRNRDNAINLNEFLGQGIDDDRGDDFDDIDYNNDGFVSRAEWHGGTQEFNYLDKNRDGRLSRYEVAGSSASMTTYNEFQNLDYNRDGRLSRSEWHWSNLSFNQADANRDGVVTSAEFDRAGGAPGTVGAISGQPSAAIAGQTIRVNSQTRWTDTGITVQRGDILRFQSSGQIQLSDNSSDVAGTAGALSRRMAPDAPITGVFAGALIGVIQGYPAFAIGDQSQITAPVSGRLFLGVNDDHLPDNRGEFTVTISVERR